jgi:very-short-patch-repair endonuclease
MSNYEDINRARKLRQSANLPEQKAWETLRTLRREGFAVRRQCPINGLTVDFAVKKARLVIEIDGGIHRLPKVVAQDRERDELLQAQGWRVLRVDSKTAMSLDHLLSVVRQALKES